MDDSLGRENQEPIPDNERATDFRGIVTEAQLDEMGRIVDSADNLVGASCLPLPAAFHVTELRNGLRHISQQLKALYRDISDTDPWA